ncbi:MAG: prepilin peptidase [Candidatus Eremiobacteraeota bacterium]|nr:prepilin peptidase [Candidatus Eremiobacteraeota bacterium]MBV8499280.1 prepilin peptidase [Candidatus Eremiobacteraeota bacterium]
MTGIALAAVFFGCIAFIATQLSRALCAGVSPAADGPLPGTPPYAILVLAAVVIGGSLVALGATPVQIGIAAMVIFALVACWCSDTLCGLVPDVFTLAPLAALLLFAAAQREWDLVASAAIVFAPFAAAAMFSRGHGMGWGDAKLVALAGAALGAPLAVFALAIACVAAVAGHRLARAARGPIAFAPYIAAATGIALPLGFVR